VEQDGPALQHENAQLRQALASAQQRVATLQASLDVALTELAALREEAQSTQRELLGQIAALAEQVAKGNDRIAELLAIAQRKKRKRRAPKSTEPVTPPDLDDGTRTAFENRPRPPEVPGKPDKPKKKHRPTGRRRLPEHLPVDAHTVYPDRCTCGCTDFDIIEEVVEEKLTVVREHQRRRVVRRKTGRCRHCRKRTTARSLPAPFPRSKATCEWMAWLIV
jgi:hypothetical protein